MNKIENYKIEKFLGQLASTSPIPGGGAVAALTGAMAASLVSMVAGLTIGKERYKKTEGRMKKVLKESKTLRKNLMVLSNKDIEAFDRVMQAYKSKNKEKIRIALKKAIEVPAKVVLLSNKVQKLSLEVAKYGNKNAFSDAKSAYHLASAARKSALENVRINRKALASLK